jgi:hypothetical protein
MYNVFIMGDAYQMPITPMKDDYFVWSAPLHLIMDNDSGLQRLCVGIAWWMLGRL